MKVTKLVVLATIVTMSSPLWAATQAITLSVPTMTCPVCPITIKKALNKVQGVDKVDVELSKKEVKVTFDDTRTNVKAITRATRNAGYPSTIVKGAK